MSLHQELIQQGWCGWAGSCSKIKAREGVVSLLAPVGQGEQGKNIVYCLWSMERFVGRGAVSLSYPVKAISFRSVFSVVCLSYEFPALPFGWGFWAFMAIKPKRSEMERVLCENCGADVPIAIKHVPCCHQPPGQCCFGIWPYPGIRYMRLLQLLARAVLCAACPSVPAPMPCHSWTAQLCLPDIVLGVRKTHQEPFGCSIKGLLYLCKRWACASPGLFPATIGLLGAAAPALPLLGGS